MSALFFIVSRNRAKIQAVVEEANGIEPLLKMCTGSNEMAGAVLNQDNKIKFQFDFAFAGSLCHFENCCR